MTEGATIALRPDELATAQRAQAHAMAKPPRAPLRSHTVITLVMFAVSGAVVLGCCIAAAAG